MKEEKKWKWKWKWKWKCKCKCKWEMRKMEKKKKKKMGIHSYTWIDSSPTIQFRPWPLLLFTTRKMASLAFSSPSFSPRNVMASQPPLGWFRGTTMRHPVSLRILSTVDPPCPTTKRYFEGSGRIRNPVCDCFTAAPTALSISAFALAIPSVGPWSIQG